MRGGGGLPARVRGQRLALRLTQRQAAERAEVSLATWQAIERAGAEPAAFQELTLARVAHGLGMDLATLLDGDAGDGGEASGRTHAATATTPDARALVADVGAALLRLAAISEETFHLVAGQALEATDRFLQVLDD